MTKNYTKKDLIIAGFLFVMMLGGILIGSYISTEGNESSNSGSGSSSKKGNTEEREIIYYKLKCYHLTARDGHELSTMIGINYRDGSPQNVMLSFTQFKLTESAQDGYVFSEVEEIKNIGSLGTVATNKPEEYVISFDFEKNPQLMQNEILKEYSYFSTAEMNYLTNEKGYSCVGDSETKMETVDISTGKKVN